MNEIIPGIPEKEWSALEKKLELVRPFAKAIHIDLMDGSFADNTTWLDPKPFMKYSKDFYLELHMMVENPIQYLKPFADAGFKRFIGHVEKMKNQTEFIAQGQVLGEVGLYLDGPTPLDAITVPLEDLDVLGIFTAEKVGFSGQPFMKEKLEKLRQIRAQQILTPRGLPLPIEVDGGINERTLPVAKEAGATRFVCTSALFGHEHIEEVYRKLHSL